MPDPIITLTTDFGGDSPYLAAMKGVILDLNPAARLVDVSHQIPPQDVPYARFVLASAIPWFPPNVIHVIVVDPGVGSERALLYVGIGGQRLLVPDNGCWTGLVRSLGQPVAVRTLTEPRFWRHPVSATFHGRDILAPVAGHLSLGLAMEELGPPVANWVQLDEPAPRKDGDGWVGEVVFVDHFGNLITNIPGEACTLPSGATVEITVDGHEIFCITRTYGEAPRGTPLVLVSSLGRMEIAVNHGNAARHLGVGVGAPVVMKVGNPLP